MLDSIAEDSFDTTIIAFEGDLDGDFTFVGHEQLANPFR
jgi:hypothetical protein